MNRHIVRYNKIINHYKNNLSGGYCEKHHIIPKCMGGNDDIENLVLLPAKAHFICHYLLHKAYPKNVKLAHAYAMMIVENPNQNRVFTGKLYERAKIARSMALKGRKVSEETKKKMRKPKSESHRKKLMGNKNGAGNKGIKRGPRTKEHSENLRKSLTPHYEATRAATLERKKMYRDLFFISNMSRKEFATYHNVNYTTMKRYLKGL